MTISFVVAFVLSATGASLANNCPVHAQGGVVLSVRPMFGQVVAKGLKGALIQRLTRPTSIPAADGDPLCAGDILSNPPNSGAVIRYRFSGRRAQEMAPGDSKSVPVPTLASRAADLIAEIDSNFGPLDYEVGAGTRGNRAWRAVMPLPDRIKVVPSLGPLILAWPDATTGTIQVSAGSKTTTAKIDGPMSIDIAKACPAGCTLTISTAAGVVRNTDIQIAKMVDVPMPPQMKIFGSDPADLVIVGAWLADVQNDLTWRVQGASLLWKAACIYPMIDPAVRAFYRLPSTPETCEAPKAF
jgi:hypothetical protein